MQKNTITLGSWYTQFQWLNMRLSKVVYKYSMKLMYSYKDWVKKFVASYWNKNFHHAIQLS